MVLLDWPLTKYSLIFIFFANKMYYQIKFHVTAGMVPIYLLKLGLCMLLDTVMLIVNVRPALLMQTMKAFVVFAVDSC